MEAVAVMAGVGAGTAVLVVWAEVARGMVAGVAVGKAGVATVGAARAGVERADVVDLGAGEVVGGASAAAVGRGMRRSPLLHGTSVAGRTGSPTWHRRVRSKRTKGYVSGEVSGWQRWPSWPLSTSQSHR